MGKYGAFKGNRPKSEVLLMPSETLEVQNMKWEKEMMEVFKFTRTEIDAFKRVRSRMQFLDHCAERGMVFNLDSF